MRTRKHIRTLTLLTGTLLLMAGCRVGKYLPKDEKLYDGADIQLVSDANVLSKTEKTALTEQMLEMARPKTNKQIFGFPYKVWLYYVIGEPKKDSSFRASLRRKLGEPPIFATSRSISANSGVWKSFLENEGYFHSSVEGSLVEKGYKAKGVYKVNVLPRYTIDSVGFLSDTIAVGKDFREAGKNTLLRPTRPYRLDNIKLERERITQEFKRKGYYYFTPDYVAVLADTATGNHKTRLYLALKPDMPDAAGRKYYIRNVYVYPNYTLAGAAQDTNRQEAVRTTAGFFVVDSSRAYDERLFHSVIGFKPGRRYNSRVQDVSLSRLINLGTFKFVRNRFAPDVQGDSTVLDVHYYLTPLPKKSLRLEIAGTSKSNNLTGSQLTLSWKNRNLFRRAELLTINGTAGIEVQLGAGSKGVTNYSYGLDATLTFPRLVSPLRIDYDRRQILPKTNITVGYQQIVRSQLYDLNSFSGSLSYSFRGNNQTEHTLTPLSLTFVKTSNFGDRFYELLTDPTVSAQYLALIQGNQLIPSSLYTLHWNSAPQAGSAWSRQFVFNAEASGNVVSLFTKDKDFDGKKDLFGSPFSQFLRADIDSRHYYKLTPSITWASRLFAGAGISYGNSTYLPFVKQYFSGGSNSIRAFRPRGIGPGRVIKQDSLQTTLLQDGGGDIKLELNTELRMKFNKYFQGALFVDAGNVWMYKDETLYGQEAVFSKDFYKEVAVGTGVGLRIDVTYFVLRFDLAFPIRKPWLPEGDRWTFKDIRFGDTDWRRKNLILNIAVGYPF